MFSTLQKLILLSTFIFWVVPLLWLQSILLTYAVPGISKTVKANGRNLLLLLLISITNIHQFRWAHSAILVQLLQVVPCSSPNSANNSFLPVESLLGLLDCGCDFVQRDLFLFLKSIYVTRDVQVVVVLLDFVQSRHIAIFVDCFPIFVGSYDLFPRFHQSGYFWFLAFSNSFEASMKRTVLSSWRHFLKTPKIQVGMLVP